MNYTRVLSRDPDGKWFHTHKRFTPNPGDTVTTIIDGKAHRHIVKSSEIYCKGCPYNIEYLSICTINTGKAGYPMCIQVDGITLESMDNLMEEI